MTETPFASQPGNQQNSPAGGPNQRGAVDLSQLGAQQAGGGQTRGGQSGGGQAGGSWVVEVTEATFDQLAQQSLQYPVLLELYSPRDPQGAEVSRTLVEATNEAQGRWLLGRINVDVETRIAQALQAQAVPFVLVLLAGQAAPLFQGTRSAAEIRQALDQISQVAIANGMTGRAPSLGPASQDPAGAAEAGQQHQQPAADPRFEAADAALERGDYAGAVEEFDKVLAQAPNDPEAIAGRAQSALLARSLDLNPEQVVSDVQARPDDVEAQLAAADLEVIGGQPAAAYERLVGLIRELRGEDREPVRLRLLELFSMMPAGDPTVAKARRALSTALFT